MGMDRTIEAGRLRFHAYYRSAGGDYGPAVEVFAHTAAGHWVEVVRYDCFAQDPHVHHFRADGQEERIAYSGGITGSVAMARGELADLSGVLTRIGYDDVADAVADDDLGAALTTLDQELTAMIETPPR